MGDGFSSGLFFIRWGKHGRLNNPPTLGERNSDMNTILQQPNFGMIQFGHHQGLVQWPENYDRRKRYPLIFFFPERGGECPDQHLHR